jgi:hypothetical protein
MQSKGVKVAMDCVCLQILISNTKIWSIKLSASQCMYIYSANKDIENLTMADKIGS